MKKKITEMTLEELKIAAFDNAQLLQHTQQYHQELLKEIKSRQIISSLEKNEPQKGKLKK